MTEKLTVLEMLESTRFDQIYQEIYDMDLSRNEVKFLLRNLMIEISSQMAIVTDKSNTNRAFIVGLAIVQKEIHNARAIKTLTTETF